MFNLTFQYNYQIEEKMGGKETSEDKQFAKLKEKENQIK